MENLNLAAHNLALAISSCTEVCTALGEKNHPCHKVVSWQANKWKPAISEVAGSKLHRPEAWTGDLTTAPIIFLSSNPSFNPTENFPSWDPKFWSDNDISKFGADRFTADPTRTYGATESEEVNEQDRTIGIQGQLSDPVSHWSWVRKFAAMVYGKSISETSAISDYVMTELVHCKSPHEEGVMDALEKCRDKWFNEIMQISPAKLIFVAGVKAGTDFAELYADQIPSTWGSWANSKTNKGQGAWPLTKPELDEMVRNGEWNLDKQLLNSVEVEISGIIRTVVYIARMGGGGGLCAPWAHPDLIHPHVIHYWREKAGISS